MYRYHQDFIEKEQLGQGGFGVVVAAVNRVDGRKYGVPRHMDVQSSVAVTFYRSVFAGMPSRKFRWGTQLLLHAFSWKSAHLAAFTMHTLSDTFKHGGRRTRAGGAFGPRLAVTRSRPEPFIQLYQHPEVTQPAQGTAVTPLPCHMPTHLRLH